MPELSSDITEADLVSWLVKPGDRVVITGRKLFYRRRKLRSEVEMHLEDGTLVCSGVLSGMGVTQ